EIVVVPQLLAGDDLAEVVEAGGRDHVVDLALAGDPCGPPPRHFPPHRLASERARLPADIDRSVIHRIAEVLAGIAADHHAAALHHEAGEGAGVAADNDRAALLVDPGAPAD